MNPMKLLILVASLFLLGSMAINTFVSAEDDSHVSEWSYSPTAADGPPNWSLNYPDCKASAAAQQSPINFRDVSVGSQLKPLEDLFKFSNGSDAAIIPSTSTLLNTGHGIQVALSDTSAVLLQDPNLEATLGQENPYRLEQFHFHSPSEHTFGGGYRDAEMHFVHHNTNSAITANEYLVVSVSFTLTSQFSANNFLNQFLSQVSSLLVSAAESQPMTGASNINLRDCLPDTMDYFTYQGSFTTPPCTEGVTWYVVKQAVPISSDQLTALRQGYSTGTHWDTVASLIPRGNYRPVQALNGRVVQHYSSLLELHGEEEGNTLSPPAPSAVLSSSSSSRGSPTVFARSSSDSVRTSSPSSSSNENNGVYGDSKNAEDLNTPIPTDGDTLSASDEGLIIVMALLIFFVLMFSCAVFLVKCVQKQADQAAAEQKAPTQKEQDGTSVSNDRTEMKDVTA